MLHIEAGKSLSLQRHNDRSEFFFMPNGEVHMNLPNVWHVLEAPLHESLDVLEVQIGPPTEEDIEKIGKYEKHFNTEKEKRIYLNKKLII